MKFLFSFLLSAITLFSFSQTGDEINQSNPKGLKVGKWIKKYQNGKIPATCFVVEKQAE